MGERIFVTDTKPITFIWLGQEYAAMVWDFEIVGYGKITTEKRVVACGLHPHNCGNHRPGDKCSLSNEEALCGQSPKGQDKIRRAELDTRLSKS